MAEGGTTLGNTGSCKVLAGNGGKGGGWRVDPGAGAASISDSVEGWFLGISGRLGTKGGRLIGAAISVKDGKSRRGYFFPTTEGGRGGSFLRGEGITGKPARGTGGRGETGRVVCDRRSSGRGRLSTERSGNGDPWETVTGEEPGRPPPRWHRPQVKFTRSCN
jgi:hypothetical protein